MNKHMFYITLRNKSSLNTSLADENKSDTRITYTEYNEMPKKACEKGFFHVIAFSQFFEMPRNQRISFSVHFLF